MKNTIKNLALVIFLFSLATISAQQKQIDTKKSNLEWKGYKVTGSHKGKIDIKSGSLTFKDNKLFDGEFTMDMTTLVNTDLTGEYKGKLEGHLKSDDFFGVAKYPTAKLLFTKVTATGKNSYKIVGDLTIKGKTNIIEFDISVYGSKATASIKIDRTKFDVRYGSTSFFDNLKDKAIYDEFDLVVDLEF